jgi:hypothetical protein
MGAFGRFAGRAAEALGMQGTAGVNAAVAGGLVAAQAILAIDEKRVAMAKEVIQLEQQRANTIRTATKQQQDNALKIGERLGNKIEALSARGGGGMAEAKRIAMEDGRDLGDVIDALLAVQGLKGIESSKAINIARTASSTGEMTMAEAIASMQGDIALQFAGNQNNNSAQWNAAARIIAKRRGNVMPSASDLSSIRGDIFAAQNSNDPLVENIRAQRRLRTQAELAGVADVEKGLGVAAAQAELAATVDRVGAALVELNRQQELTRAQLKASAEAQGAFAAAVKNFGMIFGGEGSEEQKLRRYEIQLNAAVNAPGRD